ncbi:MAG: alpha/beta hydrolase family protein [Gemmatimonadota bacterium]
MSRKNRQPDAPGRIVRCGAILATVAVAALRPAVSVAQEWSPAEGFLVRLGSDTIAVESFSSLPGALRGELADRTTGTRYTYRLAFDPDLRATSFEADIRTLSAPAGSEPRIRTTTRLAGDSAFVELEGGNAPPHQRLPTSEGAVPFLNLSFALVEHVIRFALRAGRDTVPLFLLSNGATLPAEIHRLSGDSIAVVTGGTELRAALDGSGRLLGATVPSQGVRVERIEAPSPDALSEHPPDYSAPADAPYDAQEVRIPVPAGHELAGTLTRPSDREGPLPAVVLITGSGAQDRDERIRFVAGYTPFRQIADALSRRGIAVLRLDDRGIGGSTGSLGEATTEDLARDIETAVAYLRGRDDIDATRIGLLGHSEGGIIAPMVAAADPGIAAIVIMAGPSRTGRGILRYQNRWVIENDAKVPEAARDSLLEASMARLDSMARDRPWIRYFLDYDPLPAARRVRVPVLVLHGATDRQVTVEQGRELAAAMREAGNPDVTLRVYPELNHLFLEDPDGDPAGYPRLPTRAMPPRVLDDIADWLTDRL